MAEEKNTVAATPAVTLDPQSDDEPDGDLPF